MSGLSAKRAKAGLLDQLRQVPQWQAWMSRVSAVAMRTAPHKHCPCMVCSLVCKRDVDVGEELFGRGGLYVVEVYKS